MCAARRQECLAACPASHVEPRRQALATEPDADVAATSAIVDPAGPRVGLATGGRPAALVRLRQRLPLRRAGDRGNDGPPRPASASRGCDPPPRSSCRAAGRPGCVRTRAGAPARPARRAARHAASARAAPAARRVRSPCPPGPAGGRPRRRRPRLRARRGRSRPPALRSRRPQASAAAARAGLRGAGNCGRSDDRGSRGPPATADPACRPRRRVRRA